MRGSQHNDPFVAKGTRLGTSTNNSGGIQGGISNGEPIVFRIAFKPPATIGKEQPTADFEGTPAVLAAKGRHDPCVVPRAVPIVEAMAALVLADAAMAQLARQGSNPMGTAPGHEEDAPSVEGLQASLAKEMRLREAFEARTAELVEASKQKDETAKWAGVVVLGVLVGLGLSRVVKAT
jgi:chorismate synthase